MINVNKDNAITVEDALIILQYTTGKATPPSSNSNGTVIVKDGLASALTGTTIELDVVPNDGYVVSMVKCNGIAIPVTDNKSKFIMPSSNAVITAQFDPSYNPSVIKIAADITIPIAEQGEPAPGKRVLQQIPKYKGTGVYHTIYLPKDWDPLKKYPVIVEYLGNTANVNSSNAMGYSLIGDKPIIWVVLPFVEDDKNSDAAWWWGNVDYTVDYAKTSIPYICENFGGDIDNILLCGYSRGAIATNYIGLHDDEIAKLWKASLAVSHYDDMHISWGMSPTEVADAPKRIARLGNKPQYICGEQAVNN